MKVERELQVRRNDIGDGTRKSLALPERGLDDAVSYHASTVNKACLGALCASTLQDPVREAGQSFLQRVGTLIRAVAVSRLPSVDSHLKMIRTAPAFQACSEEFF